MKNLLKITTLGILLLCSAVLQAQTDTCFLRGRLADIGAEKIYLYVDNITDSSLVCRGSFKINVPIKSPKFAIIDVVKKNMHTTMPLFLDQGELDFYIDSAKTVHVSGAKLSVEYQDKLWDPVKRANENVAVARKNYMASKKSNTADSTVLKTIMDDSIHACFSIAESYARTHPGSVLSLTALNMMGRGDPTEKNGVAELQALFNTLTPEIRESEEGKLYATKLKRLIIAGKRQ